MKVLRISKDDEVDMEVWAKYTNNSWNGNSVTGMASAIVSAFGSAAAGTGAEAASSSLNSALNNPGGTLFNPGSQSGKPQAYLQYVFFNNNHQYVSSGSGFIAVTTQSKNKFAKVQTYQKKYHQDGYLLIYVANESYQNAEVYFDDLKIIHSKKETAFRVTQTNEYYPFGLVTNKCWRAEGYADPGLLYQSSYASYDSLTGYYDFLSRSYDPALGRFFAVDPAGQFSSPYTGMGNLPHMGVDPDGEVWFVPLIVGGLLNVGIKAATTGFDNGWQALGAFAVGAATTAVTMGVSNGLTAGFNMTTTGLGTFGQGFAAGISNTFSGSGLNASLMAPSFFKGAAVGASSGLAGGFVGGFGNGLNDGRSFNKALSQGLEGAGIGAVSGGLYGGLKEGIAATKDGRRFFDGGERKFKIYKSPISNNYGKVNGECALRCFEEFSDSYGKSQYDYKYWLNQNNNKLGVPHNDVKGLVNGSGVFNSENLRGTGQDLANAIQNNKRILIGSRNHAGMIRKIKLYTSGRVKIFTAETSPIRILPRVIDAKNPVFDLSSFRFWSFYR